MRFNLGPIYRKTNTYILNFLVTQYRKKDDLIRFYDDFTKVNDKGHSITKCAKNVSFWVHFCHISATDCRTLGKEGTRIVI